MAHDVAQTTVRTPPARVSQTPEQLRVGRHAHDAAAPHAAGNGKHSEEVLPELKPMTRQ
jgi:hypothetical protein